MIFQDAAHDEGNVEDLLPLDARYRVEVDGSSSSRSRSSA